MTRSVQTLLIGQEHYNTVRESQNESQLAEIGRDLKRSPVPNSHLSRVTVAPWISLRMETLQPLWAARASAHSRLHSKVLPDVQMETPEFWFAPTASCPITRHHQREPGSIFSTVSFRYFHTLMRSLLSRPSSRLNSHTYLSLFSDAPVP